MSTPSSILKMKENPFWEKSDTPIWIASSFFLQRNLASSPFPQKLDQAHSLNILTSLKKSLLEVKALDMPQFFGFEEIKGTEIEFLCEHFLTTYDSQNSECQTGVVVDKSGTFLAIMARICTGLV